MHKVLSVLATSIVMILNAGIAPAQCPVISAAMIDAYGPSSTEGQNEFIVFTTGDTELDITTFSIGYGTTVAATNPNIDGSTPGIWLPLAASPGISNNGGTIINITSGNIPPHTPVMVLPDYYSIDYDLSVLGPTVYVLCFDHSKAGALWSTTGNFANGGSTARYFRITAGACNRVVSYIPDSLVTHTGIRDGAGAQWDSAGNITYINSGYSGIVLPLGLLAFKGKQEEHNSILLEWASTRREATDSFIIEKSYDGQTFSSIYNTAALVDNSTLVQRYSFTDYSYMGSHNYYRLHLKSPGQHPHTLMTVVNTLPTGTFDIYPNPACSHISIITRGLETGTLIALLNSGGTLAASCLSTDNVVTIDMEILPPGVYWLVVPGMSQLKPRKITKL